MILLPTLDGIVPEIFWTVVFIIVALALIGM